MTDNKYVPVEVEWKTFTKPNFSEYNLDDMFKALCNRVIHLESKRTIFCSHEFYDNVKTHLHHSFGMAPYIFNHRGEYIWFCPVEDSQQKIMVQPYYELDSLEYNQNTIEGMRKLSTRIYEEFVQKYCENLIPDNDEHMWALKKYMIRCRQVHHSLIRTTYGYDVKTSTLRVKNGGTFGPILKD